MIPGPAMVWLISSVFGAFVSGWNLREAGRDLQALGGITNGRRLLARGHVRREGIRLAIQVTWAVMGVAVLAAETASRVPPPTWSPVAVALVATNIALTLQVWLDYRERVQLKRLFG